MVNGKSAFIYYISPTQINILTPPDALAGSVPTIPPGVASGDAVLATVYSGYAIGSKARGAVEIAGMLDRIRGSVSICNSSGQDPALVAAVLY